MLLNTCQVIERPSKKDGFCFKLFHPLEQSIWAPRGPEKEAIGTYLFLSVHHFDIICGANREYFSLRFANNFNIISKIDIFRCRCATFADVLLNFPSTIASGRQMLVGRTWIVVALLFINSALDERVTTSFTARHNYYSWNSMERGGLWKAFWWSRLVSLTKLPTCDICDGGKWNVYCPFGNKILASMKITCTDFLSNQ